MIDECNENLNVFTQGSGLPRERPADESTALHDAKKFVSIAQHRDALKGVAIYHEQIGVLVGFNRAEGLS